MLPPDKRNMKSQSRVSVVQRATFKEVFVYYSKRGVKFRVSTKVRISNDVANLSEELLNAQEEIRKTHVQVELLIERYYNEHGEGPPAKWLKAEYKKAKFSNRLIHTTPEALNALMVGKIENEDIKIISSEEILSKGADLQCNILAYWHDFITLKIIVSRNADTTKRYNSLAVTLVKFQERYYDYGYDQVGLNDINIHFLIDFLRYMIKEHEFTSQRYTINPELPNPPQVGISNNTAIKRLSDFIEYLKFLKRKKGIPISIDDMRDCVKTAKRKLQVSKEPDETKWELTLTVEELQFLVNLRKYEPEYYQTLTPAFLRYLAIFIFMCLQGTSPIDTKKINWVSTMRGILSGKRSKTNVGFKVELDPISEVILKDYDYNLDFNEPTFNEAIKKIMVTVFELYRPRFEAKYDERYQLIYVQTKFKGSTEANTILHKGLYAEAMTGRRTFITNLNEDSGETNLKENMRRTGHTQVLTHLGYQKDRQTGKKKKTSLFGIFLED